MRIIGASCAVYPALFLSFLHLISYIHRRNCPFSFLFSPSFLFIPTLVYLINSAHSIRHFPFFPCFRPSFLQEQSNRRPNLNRKISLSEFPIFRLLKRRSSLIPFSNVIDFISLLRQLDFSLFHFRKALTGKK